MAKLDEIAELLTEELKNFEHLVMLVGKTFSFSFSHRVSNQLYKKVLVVFLQFQSMMISTEIE